MIKTLPDSKKRILDSIAHKALDKLPLMYRALPEVNKEMLNYFGLENNLKSEWESLLENLGADNFSSGAGLGKFTTYYPKYTGNNHINPIDNNLFYAWGIKSYFDEKSSSINYFVNKDFQKLEDINTIKKFAKPTIKDFEYENIKVDEELSIRYFPGTGLLNCIYMLSLYLRGFDQLMIELISNKKLAKYYIDMIGEFAFELNKKILEKIGNEIDFYRQWDDMAMQSGLIIPLDIIREFYLPWYKKLFSEAKKYNLITFFHICGNVNEIVPDLIEIGVDILDPVQTSATDMNLEDLKQRYGKDITFHGGIDVQEMLPKWEPKKLKEHVKKIEELFLEDGGIILGPSHEITVDTPTENILAVYRPDLVCI